MGNKKISNDIFDKIKKKTNVSENKIRALASKVRPQDLQDERRVRALIAQVGAMAGVPVSKQKEDQIVNYLIKNKMSIHEMQNMIQMFLKPKK